MKIMYNAGMLQHTPVDTRDRPGHDEHAGEKENSDSHRNPITNTIPAPPH